MKTIVKLSKKWLTCMVILVSMFFAVCLVTVTADAYAYNYLDNIAYAEMLSKELFGEVEVRTSEYLYDFDDSPAYIHVDFGEHGYAIYFRDTMELIEYAPIGSLPYDDDECKKYYGGPTEYLKKEDSSFVKMSSDSGQYTSPDFDINNILLADPVGSKSATYIPNAQYFVSSPTHGKNVHGTCGSVAAQLLLGYNNFYNDRRIISPEYLNGNWNNFNGNNDIYDPTNYNTPGDNPNACNDPRTITAQTAGSNNDFYNYVIQCVEPSALSCVDTTDSNGNTLHSHNGSSLGDIMSGLRTILTQQTGADKDVVKATSILFGSIDSQPIKSEIDAGRPLIIGMHEKLGGINHWVVGYGYQEYTYKTGHPNAGETYSGYIVHSGWSQNRMWINESWCDSYLTVQIEHEHSLNIDTQHDVGGDARELRCEECGYRTVDELYTLNASGDTIIGCNYDRVGSITIPAQINKKDITAVGDSAFSNQYGITSIILSNTIESIGERAFEGCSALTALSIPANITSIGDGAFAGCDSLAIRVAANNPNYTAQDNILYNKHKTALLSSGNVAPEVHILQTVETIATSAFQGNGKLQNVHIEHCPAIGKFAFADCENLRAAYFYSYTVPTLGNGAFANNDFTLYAPHHLQGTYHSAFYGYTTKIDSIPIEISFMVDGAEWQCVPTYFGANIDTIPEPFREGYDFAGWYDSADYAGQAYAVGGTWTTAQDMCVYAKWTPKQYQIYFTGDGSEGLADKTVTYDSPIGTLPTPVRKGYTFLGWYDTNGEQYAETDDWKKLSNISVSSKWRINEYTIRYDGNGGTVSESAQKATYQCVIDSLAVATKEGFTFLEWNTAADGTGKTVRAPYTYDSDDDLTLYAQYSQNQYTVTFNKQNGSGGSDGVNVDYQAAMPTGLTAPTRPGYAFQGYYAQPNGEGTCYYDRNMTGNAVWDIARDDTIYAYWVGNTYNVSLHRQGGTGGCGSVQATYGSAMPTGADITAPTKTGYVFRGYYADLNGKGTQYYHADMTSANPWNISEDRTLYAYWTAKVYTVTLNRQSGSGGSASVQATYYAAMPTATAPIRAGYTFQGYYEKPDGAGTKYYHANMASANIWDVADNKEIYAYWIGNQYTVKLDSGGYGGTGEVNATFGSPMPTAGIVAPRRTGYTFKGYYDQRNGNGAKYYDGPNLVSVHVWDKTSGCTLYAYWEQNTYTITLQQYGNNTSEIQVKYGDVVTVEDFAPGRWGYQFIGYYANANGTGTEYFTAEWQTYYGSTSYMLVSRNVRWYKESDGVIYAKWAVCSMNYDIHYYSTEDASIIYTETVRLVNEQTITLGAKEVKGYVFKQWNINGATYTDTTRTYKASLIYSYVVQGTMIASYPYDTPGSIYAMYDKDSCVAEGTLITLSDGRQVPVETLTGNELLLVWNLKTGRFDTAPILFIDKDPTRIYRVINLYFSDGTTVKVISEHGFWDCDLNRYVYLDENAVQYIGHWFNKAVTDGNGQMTRVKVRLENVVVRDEYTTAYSPVTYQHLCYYVNGMLSMPGGIGGLFNIFAVDGDTMQYDSAAMAADISKYGLFTYEEFAEYVPVPVEVFEAFDAQYFKVAIGKGLLDYAILNRLAERYAPLLGIGGDA